ITFPVERCKKIMYKSGAKRIGRSAAVYLAAVLEYLSLEILELSGNSARERGKSTIKTRDLFLVVANDPELRELLHHLKIEFAQSGVLPFIDARLFDKMEDNKKHRKKTTRTDTSTHRYRPGTVAMREV